MTDTKQSRILALREKIAGYSKEVNRLQYEDNLSKFVEGAWPHVDSAQYERCWAIDALCDHLEAVTLGHIPRLLINYPPRCAKTTVASISYPAWTWARSQETFLSGPKVRFLCASYNHDLAMKISNKSRRLLLSPWYQKYWGHKFTLKIDQNTKTHFDNTSGGSRITTSVGGSLLGIGGDVLVGDDLHNTEKAESEADREKVLNFWKEFSSTRLNDPNQSAIIVIMQRLHRQDVSGVILDGDENWTHLCLPMRHDERRHCVTVTLPQYDDPDPWEDPRTVDGELMWPERFNDEAVRRIESRLGKYMASGRLQQDPRPAGGGIIEEGWWKLWDHQEAQKYGLEWKAGRREFPVPMELVVGSVDTAFKEKEENDYNAMTVWGIFLDRNKNRRAMLMYAWQKRLPLNGTEVDRIPGEAEINFKQRQKEAWGLVQWVADTCKRYKVSRLLIEDKARGYDVCKELRRLYARDNWGIQLVNPIGDKVSRMHSIEPMFTDGAIYAPDLQWAAMVINEMADFPKGAHDDLCDTASMAIGWLRENEILIRCDEMSVALEDEAAYVPRSNSVAEQYGV